MEIKTGNIDSIQIKYVEYNSQDYDTKLITVSEGSQRKSVETFCKENNGELAINGGLFNYSGMYTLNNVASYIDGVQNSSGELVHDGLLGKPAIFFTKENNMFPEYFFNRDFYEGLKWARNVAYYCCVNNGKVGCFSSDTALNSDIPVNEYNESKIRTIIGKKYNGNIVIACSIGKITGKQEGNFMKNLGCEFAFNLDGGGSTHMYDGANAKYIVKGNRNVTDAIVVVKKPKPLPPRKCRMKLTGSAARLRSDIPKGNIQTTIPNGTIFSIVGLYSWKAPDGYRWGWGEYNGYAGYFQYDPAVMNPVGLVSAANYKMILTGSAARLRKTIRGEVITTVPNGNTIQILEFIDGKQSDGYQWCRGSYNGQSGYFQYDPAVMFPTND